MTEIQPPDRLRGIVRAALDHLLQRHPDIQTAWT
jgi:hypothetical protein